MKRTIYLVLINLISVYNIYATDYYLSATGNDNNNGMSSSSPWKSLTKLNNEINSLTPGSHIYFKRGDKFSGQIDILVSGSLSNRIVFNAYGSGANPIITGAVSVSGWTLIGTNIWKAPITAGTVKQLFENDNRLPIARYPNNGYLRMNTGGSTSTFVDAELSQPTNYFKDADVVMQSSDYTWEFKKVNASTTGGAMDYAAMDYTNSADLGYFFTNKYSFVDTINEWFYDTLTHEVFLYSQVNPNSKNIEASVYDYGIKGNYNREYLTIQNIDFEKQCMDGIWFIGAPCKYNTIKNCNFFNQMMNGVQLMGDSINVINCYFENIGGLGVLGNTLYNSKISNNTFNKIGLTPGIGNGSTGDLQAIRCWSGNHIYIGYNTIDSTGYNGITIIADNSKIEKNIIENSLLFTADGGGLYSYNHANHHNVYNNNIIGNIIGNVVARPVGTHKIVNALYMDNYVSDVQILNNTLHNVDGNGIVINAGAHDNVIEFNNTYKCLSGINMPDWLSGGSVYNNKVKHNVFYANTNGGVPVLLQSDDNHYSMFSVSDSNYLCTPYSNIVVRYEWSITASYDLAQWQNLTGHDQHSVLSYYNWTFPIDSSFIIINTSAVSSNYTFTDVVDLDNNPVNNVLLAPFSSKILIQKKSLTTSISEQTLQNNIGVYPNPCKNQVNIITDENISSISIYDLSGQLVLHEKNVVNKSIEIGFLSQGAYIIETTINNNSIRKLFMKK